MESPRSGQKPYLFPIVLVIFGLALFLRLTSASTLPFTRADADLAWQALEVSKHQVNSTSPLALYTGLTGVLFWISSTSNFVARLVPALFGASLTLIPYTLLKNTNNRALLGISLLLALDPIFLIYSRQIDGPILAISTIAWLLVFLYQRRQVAAGVSFGLAILSGKYFWITLFLIFILGLLLYFPKHKSDHACNFHFELPGKSFLYSSLLTGVLVSTSFLLNPAGLNGITSGLVDLFMLSTGQFLPWYLPIFILLTYSLYLLLPFGITLSRATNISWQLRFSVLIGLLLLSLALQNYLSGLFLFVEAFLLTQVALLMTRFDLHVTKITLVRLISFVFFLVILIFSLLSFSEFARNLTSEFSFAVDLLPLLLALGLIMISYILIGLGWGFSEVKPALLTAIVAVTVLFSLGFSLSQTWNDATVSQLLFSNSEILYPDSPTSNQLAVFTANNAINPDTDSFNIDNVLSKGDYWEFKGYADSARTNSLPAFVINDSTTESGLMSAYRGTSITYTRRLNLSEKAFAELLRMIATKTLPVSNIRKTLWVNASLFPGGK
jgi:hypothetical protein